MSSSRWIVPTVLQLFMLFTLSNCNNSGLSFISVGDWGLKNDAQKKVAESMEQTAKSQDVAFVISLGDNFYPSGVTSVKDPAWQTFDVFRAHPTLKIPFYGTLGNHDWRSDCWWQIQRFYEEPSSGWVMPNYWYYTLHTFEAPLKSSHPYKTNAETSNRKADAGTTAIHGNAMANYTLAIVFLDSEIAAGSIQPSVIRDVQNKWFADVIKQLSNISDWVFVATHRPFFSSGTHGDSKELINDILPLVEKAGAHALFSGHDHHLEVLQDTSMDRIFVVSGGGSKTRALGKSIHPLSKYANVTYGYTQHLVTGTQLHTTLFDFNRNVLYTHTLTKGDTTKVVPTITESGYTTIKRPVLPASLQRPHKTAHPSVLPNVTSLVSKYLHNCPFTHQTYSYVDVWRVPTFAQLKYLVAHFNQPFFSASHLLIQKNAPPYSCFLESTTESILNPIALIPIPKWLVMMGDIVDAGGLTLDLVAVTLGGMFLLSMIGVIVWFCYMKRMHYYKKLPVSLNKSTRKQSSCTVIGYHSDSHYMESACDEEISKPDSDEIPTSISVHTNGKINSNLLKRSPS